MKIPTTELLVELAPLAPWRLPLDPARMVRSAMVKAFFELVCQREHRQCRGCDLVDRCEMTGWLDPGKGGSHRASPILPAAVTPGGAVLVPGDPMRVRLWLLGKAPRPGLLIEALVRMARGGLGPDRVPHRLSRLTVDGHHGRVRMVDDELTVGIWPEPDVLERFAPLPRAVTGATVYVLTPMVWRGARPDVPPTAADLVQAAIGRLRQTLRELGLPQPPRWPDPTELRQRWSQARWHPAHHRSSGEGVQSLAGWTGVMDLGPEVAPWAEPLAAGSVLGLGSATSAGRGRVSVAWR